MLLLVVAHPAWAGKADDSLNVAFSDEVETLDSYKATGRAALMVTRLISAWRAGKAPLYLTNWGSYGIADVELSVGHYFDGRGDDLTHDAEMTAAIKLASVSVDPVVRKA